MNNLHLKQEISTLLSTIKQIFGKNSREYEDAEYYLDVLETIYKYNCNEGRDLLEELDNLLNKLSYTITELTPEKFKVRYPNISQMINYLDEWLP